MRQPVYTFDIDFAGIVSNIVYLRWSEIWRIEFLKRIGLTVEEMMRVIPSASAFGFLGWSVQLKS